MADVTPLDRAYTAGKQADAAAVGGEFAQAGKLYTEAAVQFEQAAHNAKDNPGKPMIEALAKQARSSAEYFGSGQAQRDKTSPRSKSPVSKRKPLSPQRHAPLAASVADLSSSVMALPIGEAVAALAIRSSTVFARTFEQSIANQSGPFMNTLPSESFYMVKPKPGDDRADNPESTTMLARAKALEQATAAQRAILKNGIQQIKNEIALKEQKIQDEYLDELDRLRAENDNLRIELSKRRK